MDIQPVNLNELVGVTLGMLVVLIPVMGVTVRFAARPLIDALLQSGLIGTRAQAAAELLGRRTSSDSESELARLSRRVLELEQELGRRRPEALAAISEPNRPVELVRTRT